MAKPQLIVSGSIAIDRIMDFSGRYRDIIKPDKLHVLSLSVLLDKLETSPGGIGANIAYGLAQLGEKPVLLGSVGDDGREYITRLQSAGIDTSHVHFSKLATSSFSVITDSEGSQVGGFYPGAMQDSASLSLAPWKDQDVMVVVAAHDPAAMSREVAQCREFGLKMVYDPGQQVSSPDTDLKAGVDAAEILFVNDYELSLLCERLKTSPEKLKAAVPLVITTLGSEGSLIEGQRLKAPVKIGIAQPRQVADPTGAGDAYRAGFLYGYLRQWELADCGQLGAVMASFVVEQHGTQVQSSVTEIKDRYLKTFNQEIKL